MILNLGQRAGLHSRGDTRILSSQSFLSMRSSDTQDFGIMTERISQFVSKLLIKYLTEREIP
jgi:hypothetical protein